MGHEVERKALARYLEDHNLKRTRQRDVILDAFLAAKGHVSSEDLYQTIRKKNPRIGYTTVYRTMKLLVEAGLAEEHHFDDGVARYEIEQEHHDHLVCTRCGRIVEFECELIEKTQTEIAEKYGFRILRHRHELYGHCSDCRDD
jgi:Fur family ferric uptake transcriptional regulator